MKSYISRIIKNPWVQCPEIPKVNNLLKTVSVTNFYRGSNQAKTQLNNLEQKYRQWIKEVVDLTDFPYFYFVNGVTDALNQWIATEHRSWQFLEGDYQYPQMISNTGVCVSEVQADRVLYISNPACATGNLIELEDYNVPVILDCAYIGSVPKQKMHIPSNTEQVWFSFSKGWGLVGQRMAVVFSKQPHKSLEPMKRVEAWNHTGVEIAHAIIDNFDIDTICNEYKILQDSICKELNLEPADCFFIANSTDEIYEVRRRTGNIARLDLSYIMNGDINAQ